MVVAISVRWRALDRSGVTRLVVRWITRRSSRIWRAIRGMSSLGSSLMIRMTLTMRRLGLCNQEEGLANRRGNKYIRLIMPHLSSVLVCKAAMQLSVNRDGNDMILIIYCGRQSA